MQASITPLALIVGGSSGMGKQTGMRLLERGAELILLAHDPTKLEKAKAENEIETDFASKFHLRRCHHESHPDSSARFI